MRERERRGGMRQGVEEESEEGKYGEEGRWKEVGREEKDGRKSGCG